MKDNHEVERALKNATSFLSLEGAIKAGFRRIRLNFLEREVLPAACVLHSAGAKFLPITRTTIQQALEPELVKVMPKLSTQGIAVLISKGLLAKSEQGQFCPTSLGQLFFEKGFVRSNVTRSLAELKKSLA